VQRYAAGGFRASRSADEAEMIRCDPLIPRTRDLKLRLAAAMLVSSGLQPRVRAAFPSGEVLMTIKVGDRLPAGTLMEYYDVEKDGCSIGPNPVTIESLARGRKLVLFGLPGAFTPTCSAKHVPSYVADYEKLKANGVDTIACMSVNDAFVMGAWGRTQHADGKIRMLADGSAVYTKALGLELDLTARGMGIRCQRFSMLVDDGVVKALNIEAPGKFEVSGADTMLAQLG
jgi:peroxiredoxin